jgi:Protein of unknown function (DUF1553)/Protein of unknown function (DUF1549)
MARIPHSSGLSITEAATSPIALALARPRRRVKFGNLVSMTSRKVSVRSTIMVLAFMVAASNLTAFAGEKAKASNTNHWAFQPVLRPSVPKAKDRSWPRTPVDYFVLQELTRHKLTPSPEADRITLARRVYFDLTGLPPTPEQVTEFVNDRRADAYERLVDKLLDSPQYGERWGQHWLDAAGYADSNGYFDADSDRPLAYKYRDYVVRSIASDKPFDQFVREQIAGDELAGYMRDGDVTPEMEDELVATHFLRNAPDGTGESDGNAMELRVDRYSVLEGTVQLIGSTFLGLTVQCARCHDHKFEPFTQQDYYQLQAILRPGYDPEQWLKPNQRLITTGTRAEREKVQHALDRTEREIKATKESIDGLTKPFRKLIQTENLQSLPEADRKKVQAALDAKEKDRNKEMKELLKKHEALVDIKDEALLKRFPELGDGLHKLEKSLKEREGNKPKALPQLSVFVENRTNEPPAHFTLVRGNYAKPGREVSPGVPTVLQRSDNPYEIKPPKGSSGRRLALANWLTSSNNPVVARLMVNRVWQHHFGAGLVRTPENFGVTGTKPTHPELLDFLASEFRDGGWKLKPLHRMIVNSAAYRQSSAHRDSAQKIDPDDTWLWRFPMQRLDSESIRDAMLAATGELELQMGGPFIPKDKTEEGQYVISESKPGAHRRSLYLQQRRTTPISFLDLFDSAKMSPNCLQRTSSTVALQSLTLLNSEFVRARSKAFAARLLKEPPQSDRIDLAFKLALGRAPNDAETKAANEFLADLPSNTAEATKWTDFCQMIFASNAFLFVE